MHSPKDLVHIGDQFIGVLPVSVGHQTTPKDKRLLQVVSFLGKMLKIAVF